MTHCTGGADKHLTQSDLFVSGPEYYDIFRIPALAVTARGVFLAFIEGCKPDGRSGSRSVDAPRGYGCRADPEAGALSHLGVANLRCASGTCGGAWVGVVQALAECGECCGLPVPAY